MQREYLAELKKGDELYILCLTWKLVEKLRYRALFRKANSREMSGWTELSSRPCSIVSGEGTDASRLCFMCTWVKMKTKGGVGWTDIAPPLPAWWSLGWTVYGIRFPLANPRSSWLEQKVALHNEAVLSGKGTNFSSKVFLVNLKNYLQCREIESVTSLTDEPVGMRKWRRCWQFNFKKDTTFLRYLSDLQMLELGLSSKTED